MEERILINYTKTEDGYLLSIVSGDGTENKFFDTPCEEAERIVNILKQII